MKQATHRLPLDRPFTPAIALQAGVSAQQLRTMVKRGEVTRLRQGHYTVSGGDRQRAVFDRIRVAIARAPRGAVITGEAAAYLHGLVLPKPKEIDVIELISSDPAARRTQRAAGFTVRTTLVPRGHIVSRHGLSVTSAAWTALEVALGQPFALALAPLDSALHLGTTRAELERCRNQFKGRHGIVNLDRAIAEADGLSASGLESQSRGQILDAGLPRPELQVPLKLGSGRMAYGDFGWREQRLIGECDGLGKYPDEHGYRKEKLREMEIRRLNLQVERWVQWDLDHGWDALLERLTQYFL